MDSKDGSKIAKRGFQNEKFVQNKFNNWKNDHDAQSWLRIMKYNIDDIETLKAVIIQGHKTDIQLQLDIKLQKSLNTENIQVKLVSNKKGYNQIDKRWVDKYIQMWKIPTDIGNLLKYFTGEKKPYNNNTKDQRRMFLNEFKQKDQEAILNFFKYNKSLILKDIFKGSGEFSADWILIIQKSQIDRWILKPIDSVINYYAKDDVVITKHGNLKIGKLTMQRKGGDNNRKTANMLQFKINPIDLFDIEDNT